MPTVRDGFMREVVIHFEAGTPSSSTTRSHPARSVYYHYFTKNSKGPTVWRVALLRAPANPDDADAEETVQGTLTLTVEDFLRSKLNVKNDALLPSDFMFLDVEASGQSKAAEAHMIRKLTELTAGDRPHLKPAVELLNNSGVVEAALDVRGVSSSGEEGEECKVRAAFPLAPTSGSVACWVVSDAAFPAARVSASPRTA